MDEHVLGLFVTLELTVPGVVSVFRGHAVPSVCNPFFRPRASGSRGFWSGARNSATVGVGHIPGSDFDMAFLSVRHQDLLACGAPWFRD